MGEEGASGDASWGTEGAADGAASPDAWAPRVGSCPARWSAGATAGRSDCAAAPFAGEPVIQRISAAPCGSSGALSAVAASAVLATVKPGEKERTQLSYNREGVGRSRPPEVLITRWEHLFSSALLPSQRQHILLMRDAAQCYLL